MTAAFEIQGPSRQCAASGRELKPGDRIFSVLAEDAGKFVRIDYAADAWTGPPAGAIAYWSGRIPASDRPKKPTFNDALLVDCFNHLQGAIEPERVNFRYVVTLLLMRRKRLKFEDSQRRPDGTTVLIVRDAKSGATWEVADPKLNEAEITRVQDEVFRLLGWE